MGILLLSSSFLAEHIQREISHIIVLKKNYKLKTQFKLDIEILIIITTTTNHKKNKQPPLATEFLYVELF